MEQIGSSLLCRIHSNYLYFNKREYHLSTMCLTSLCSVSQPRNWVIRRKFKFFTLVFIYKRKTGNSIQVNQKAVNQWRVSWADFLLGYPTPPPPLLPPLSLSQKKKEIRLFFFFSFLFFIINFLATNQTLKKMSSKFELHTLQWKKHLTFFMQYNFIRTKEIPHTRMKNYNRKERKSIKFTT